MVYFDQILLDTPTLLVSYSSQYKLVQAQWRGRFDAALAQQQCLHMLASLPSTQPVHRMINDSSEAFGEWLEAGDWIGRVLAPALAARGVRAVAWINAMDWPSRDAVACSVSLTQELPIKTFDFDEADTALAWVLSIKD
ncbi:STAS/SEC14 domain-containing protein [Hymenobacter lapidiphilus]|uniref:STAS/SEC14 domain-containing protein n=1 Tax=Hymenobacter sp. CCM 8763 TaxID=2303334 RepID=UPI000E34B4FA|nr:STAS/SEC14 domain-containing protein [Hymenobacter sp. CCM 8763]RFP64666.1 STAS/SEC14 domain-containing protein [Hymenobacter sp. CCM 8763]